MKLRPKSKAARWLEFCKTWQLSKQIIEHLNISFGRHGGLTKRKTDSQSDRDLISQLENILNEKIVHISKGREDKQIYFQTVGLDGEGVGWINITSPTYTHNTQIQIK